MREEDGMLHVVELLVGNNANKPAIIERARTAPLHVRDELFGDGEAEATYGLDVGWNASKATVRVIASAKIRCGSNPERHLKAMEHCQSLVQAVVADEVPRMQKLMKAMGEMDMEPGS